MHIASLSLVAGFAVVMTGMPIDTKIKDKTTQKPSQEMTTSEKQHEQLDPIITGKTVKDRQLESWETRAKRYRECPECVANQPFPGE